MTTHEQKRTNLSTIYSSPIYYGDEEPWKEDWSKLYLEVPLLGVADLLTTLQKVNGNKDNHTFMDIGSGNGKLLLHWLNMSKCKNVIGIERNQKRCRISKDLYKKMEGLEDRKFKVINKDVMKYKKFDAEVIFINDIFFKGHETLHIWNNMKPDAILMTYKVLRKTYPIAEIKVPVNIDLKDTPTIVNFYRKPMIKGGMISRLGLIP